MPGIGNNLYPPIVNTWMPAFVRTSTCKIYFSLSIYNNIKDLVNAQIVVNNQFNNLSALDTTKYPTGIKICPIRTDDTISTDDKYYIEIDPNDLTSKVFELNQFYKVQIRFTGTAAAPMASSSPTAAWLVENQKYFSEWSTVCLIKGIEQPLLYLKGFEHDSTHGDYEITFATEVLDLVGQLYYNNNAETEKEALKYYHVLLYKSATSELIFDSGDVYTNVYNPNEINYTLKTNLENGTRYRLKFTYVTTNEYSDTVEYYFTIFQNTLDALQATIEAAPDVEYGRIAIKVKATIKEAFFGNLTIRRSSSETNFQVWEDIHQEPIANGEPLDYTWYDYTIESGVWYKYGVQKRNTRGDRGKLLLIDLPVLINLDDMFLTREGMQFTIRYDPSVSSFKYNYSEVKVDTLGSQYPLFRRNGNIKYRTFPIGGLITAFCDEQGVFLNRDNIYKEARHEYDVYNEEKNIDEYKDFIYEREFREKIMDFLYADNVKLFRSATEGNILVRLMDISFTPNQTLGRMLYAFTATAYEIDECSLENFEKYGIQTVGDYSTDIVYRHLQLGQLVGTYEGNNASNEIINVVKDHFEKEVLNNHTLKVSAIKWLRMSVLSDTYLIKTNADGSLVKTTDKFNENIVEGDIAYVNGNPMIISPRKFIEFKDEDTMITSVYFPYSTETMIDYIVELEEREMLPDEYSRTYFYIDVGQVHDTYNADSNIFNQIYSKYLYNYSTYSQQIISLDKIVVEANPGTVISIKDSYDNEFFDHEINDTGVLRFYDDEAAITGIKYVGVHLYPVADASLVKERGYYNTGVSVSAASAISNPIENGVYTIGGNRMIYHEGQFYNFGTDDIVGCPTDITIDYIYEKVRGEY